VYKCAALENIRNKTNSLFLKMYFIFLSTKTYDVII
jgi:hypothetical protein